MSTKPYPDLLSSSRAKPASQEATAQPEVAVDQDRVEAAGSSDAPDEAETEEATARSEDTAEPSPMFRAPLKYIEIPPDLLAEMQAKPLARMPTGELYATRKFDLPPKDETEGATKGEPSEAEGPSTTGKPAPFDGDSEPRHEVTVLARALGIRKRFLWRAGALLASCAFMFGWIWTATHRPSTDGPPTTRAVNEMANGVESKDHRAPRNAGPESTTTKPTPPIDVADDTRDTTLVEREPQATANDEPHGSKSSRPAPATPSAPKPSAPPKKPATPPSSDEAVDTKTPFTGL